MIHAKENNWKKGSKRKRHFKEDDDKSRNSHICNDKNEEGNNTKESTNSLNKFIYEGSVKIKNKKNHIFYNKAQVFNRDMSIVLIKALEIFMKEKNKNNEKIIFRGFNIIELLSASGMRSIRYAKELEDTINHITTNDIDKYACKQIKRNFIRNNIKKEKYTILCNDANSVMNILNVDNMYIKKRNNKKLDIGFTYINNINNCIDYFKEAFKFLNFLTNYNRRKHNPLENVIEHDSDSTTFLSNDDEIITTKIDNSGEDETYIYEEKYDKNNIHCNEQHNRNVEDENKCLDDIKKKDIIKKSKLIERYMFDIIDIDPYGSSIEYLESCLKYGRSNFFILITNTDMRILNGKFPDVSFYKYNSMIFSNKVNYNNEFSIRVLFYKIKIIASKYKKCIIPFISINIDFYIRLLVHVIDDALQTKDVCIDTGMVYQCNNCSSFHINPMAYKKDVNHLSCITENHHTKKRRKMKKNKMDLLENAANEINGDIKKDENNDDDNIKDENNDDNNNNDDNIKDENNDDNNNNDDNIKDENNDDNNNNDDRNNHNNIHKSDDQNHNEAGGDANQNCKNAFTSYKYKSTKLNISKICEECGGDILIGGPIYIGKLHNEDLSTYINFKICSFSRKLLVNALLNLNYEVSYFHKDPDSVKTNAPNNVFMDIFRAIIFKINSKKKNSNQLQNNKTDQNNLTNNENQNNDNYSVQTKKIYSIDTIKDEKLKEKLLSYQFFKKNTSFENINISNFKKETNTHKLFTLENPEPFWGPMRKHYEKN
ncbi:N2,N2-dimethylguanosine tRNA methyltransferase [Plasmodium falciparum IGH-CR14]|uniref:tRNA (guanine(26)-N(2))-dimethyltransferase n=1 Tax=Plasmodium falciparum IGH-CR14 TaxID=580059 RepID=A0A0L1ID49_PLAFA|nr:N2,N2-dimethylguanosine tRNA methyltransferase [Plasmodium falciparum IGH-CR14]